MTNAEAIETLRANYPDRCFEQLRAAVDKAIKALEAQDATGDSISRQAAIRIASGYCHPANIADELRKLPSAQPDSKELSFTQKKLDTISRQAAIDAVKHAWAKGLEPTQYIEDMPSAQPEEQHGRVFKGIVVEYPSYYIYPEYIGKPYFSIKYTENGQEFIGYGTYKPEVLSEYLKEYFMPSAQPDLSSYSDKLWRNAYERGREEAEAEIIRCKDCKWKQGAECVRFAEIRVFPDDFCSRAERRTDDKTNKSSSC